jgi:hypothetical protein
MTEFGIDFSPVGIDLGLGCLIDINYPIEVPTDHLSLRVQVRRRVLAPLLVEALFGVFEGRSAHQHEAIFRTL